MTAVCSPARVAGRPKEILVLHERSNIEIDRKHMACMKPLTWLNDEIINIYMALLIERDRRRREQVRRCELGPIVERHAGGKMGSAGRCWPLRGAARRCRGWAPSATSSTPSLPTSSTRTTATPTSPPRAGRAPSRCSARGS